jgi:hypothetical protein
VTAAGDVIEDQTGSELLDRALTRDELDDLVEAEPSPVAVTFSTQDFDVAGLVQRLNRGSMLVPSFGLEDPRITTAGFQRGFVWTKAQMDRFIESLLLGYPVPGIFLVKQADNKLLVLDGQQRLVTLQRFFEGLHAGKEFTLEYVGKDYKGVTYKSLDESLRYQLDDSYLQATIVAADGSEEVNEAVYQIFERLNAGGTQLTPHEIRVALYAGELIAFLERLNQLPAWRALYGKASSRIRDQELVLRVIALYLSAASYARPLKTFLNTFAAQNRSMNDTVRDAGRFFEIACAAVVNGLGPAALRRSGAQVNMAQAEAVLVGVMAAMADDRLVEDLHAALQGLLEDEAFVQATTRATADNDSVAARLRLARAAFRR